MRRLGGEKSACTLIRLVQLHTNGMISEEIWAEVESIPFDRKSLLENPNFYPLVVS